MRLVGFNAPQVRQGVCQRGTAPRQGPRITGPIGSDTLADHIVKLNVRDLEALFNGVIRALAKAGVFAAKVTGIVDATDWETPAGDEGCGQGEHSLFFRTQKPVAHVRSERTRVFEHS
jgi:hypothetical protein